MRSKKVVKRLTAPDPIYGSIIVTKFINKIMRDGKKTVAQRLVYQAMEEIKSKGQEPLQTLQKAMENVSPKMEVRPRRVGGASYQVPTEVRGDRKEALAIRWILSGAEARANKEFHTFGLKLAAELLDAANNPGIASKKKEDIQKVANANRAFAHFRW